MTKHLLAVGLVMAAVATLAYAQEGTVVVKVPFTFVVADKTLPAGQYGFFSEKENVYVQDQRGGRIAILLANHVSGRSAGKTGQVVFECYEAQCFLSEVWSPLLNDGRQVLRSKLQMEVAAKKPATYMTFAATK